MWKSGSVDNCSVWLWRKLTVPFKTQLKTFCFKITRNTAAQPWDFKWTLSDAETSWKQWAASRDDSRATAGYTTSIVCSAADCSNASCSPYNKSKFPQVTFRKKGIEIAPLGTNSKTIGAMLIAISFQNFYCDRRCWEISIKSSRSLPNNWASTNSRN